MTRRNPPIPLPSSGRRTKPKTSGDGNISLADLYAARQTAATYVMHNQNILPIFERIEREIADMESKMHTIARAAAALNQPAYIEGKSNLD